MFFYYSKNIQKVFKSYMYTGERPEKYRRVRKRANKIDQPLHKSNSPMSF